MALVEQRSIPAAVNWILRVHRDRGQVETGGEDLAPDAGDARGDGDTGDVALGERLICDTGDRMSGDGGRNGDWAARTGVAGDGYGASVGRVSELGLRRHRGGQEQNGQKNGDWIFKLFERADAAENKRRDIHKYPRGEETICNGLCENPQHGVTLRRRAGFVNQSR